MNSTQHMPPSDHTPHDTLPTQYRTPEEPSSGVSDIRPRAMDDDIVGTTYPVAVRRRGWWRPLVALLVVVVGFPLVNLTLSVGAWALDEAFPQLAGGRMVTPAAMLALNLSWGSCILISLGVQRLLYGPSRDLHSVMGRFRWSLLGRAAIIVVPVWLVVGVLNLVFVELEAPALVDWLLAAVVLLTTPLQATGEEYLFRGLLNRGFASWSGRRRAVGVVVGLVLSSALFMLAHFAFQPMMLLYYFTFGASLAVIAWRTGGIEVPALVHSVHNVVLMAAGTFMVGDGADGLATRGEVEVGLEMLPYIGLMVAAAAVTWIITKRRPVQRTVPAEEPVTH